MKFKSSNLAPVWIALAVIALVCGARYANFPFFERLELITYDIRVRQAVKFFPAKPDKLGFVFIDESTLKAVRDCSLGYRYGLYWPRQVYGRALHELQEQGARAVGLDVIFGELRPDHAPVQMADGTLVESDDFFARQLQMCTNAILALNGEVAPPRLFLTNAHSTGDISTEKDSDGILRRVRAFRVYRDWHPVFKQLEADPEYGVDLKAASVLRDKIVLHRRGVEDIPVPLDQDGCFDLSDFGAPPAVGPSKAKPFAEVRVWHMGIVLAARELGLDLDKASVDLNRGSIVLRGPGGIAREWKVDSEARFFVDWSITPDNPHLKRKPLQEVLRQNKARLEGSPEVSSEWKDKLVVVGSSAVMGNDLADVGATPISPHTLLISKHWNVANSILQNQFIHRTPIALDMLLITLLGGLAAVFTWRLRAVTALVLVVMLAVAYIFLASGLFVHSRYWLPIIYPVLGALLMTHVCLVTWRVVFEQAARRRVASVLATIVSPKIAKELLRAEKLSLGGARREITVLFADVRGFTELTDSSQARAEEYVLQKELTGPEAEACIDEQARATLATINLYLGTVADVIVNHDGTLDKFIGDCVMAFWGAPTAVASHATACVRAAIESQRAIEALNTRRRETNRQLEIENKARVSAGLAPKPLLPVLCLGTGINTGMATVGLMGSEVQTVVRQGNYTVFGREVNLASRLESLSGSGHIYISQSTFDQLKRDDPELAARCAPLPPVTVKGIRNAVQVYEVPWSRPEAVASATASNEPALNASGSGGGPATATN